MMTKEKTKITGDCEAYFNEHDYQSDARIISFLLLLQEEEKKKKKGMQKEEEQ